MNELNTILVVFDPTQEQQPALDRAAKVAEETGACLHLFACIYSDLDKVKNREEETSKLVEEQQAILSAAAGPLIEKGARVVTEVEWGRNWYHAVVQVSEKTNADIVFKSSYRHSTGKRLFNRTSDWTLIRECQCPVLLVKECKPAEEQRVLAAVDIRARTESYEKLNDNIIDFSRRVLEHDRAEVHFVNAFEDFRALPDRQALSEKSGIESGRIHIKLGAPEKVIVDTARKVDATLVVVGNSGRTGIAAAFHGNTVEKVLDKLECDVLSMP